MWGWKAPSAGAGCRVKMRRESLERRGRVRAAIGVWGMVMMRRLAWGESRGSVERRGGESEVAVKRRRRVRKRCGLREAERRWERVSEVMRRVKGVLGGVSRRMRRRMCRCWRMSWRLVCGWRRWRGNIGGR